MSLEQNIAQDLKQALKDKNEIVTNTLRMLKSAFKNLAIEKKVESLEDSDALSVVKKELKKRHDSIKAYQEGNRPELAEKEKKEAEVLKKYMPEMMSEGEIVKLVEEAISSGAENFGQIMKEVMAKAGGQADGKLVGEIVKQKIDSSK